MEPGGSEKQAHTIENLSSMVLWVDLRNGRYPFEPCFQV